MEDPAKLPLSGFLYTYEEMEFTGDSFSLPFENGAARSK